MNSYELTVVLPGKVTTAKKKAVREKTEKMVKTLKGKVGKVEDWGEIELAYEINESSSGIYLHFPLELEAAVAKNINEKLKLEGDIIRYLLIRKDKKAKEN